MTSRRRGNTTKLEIVQVATRMFLEKGYSNTSVKAVCDELGISTGNLTFYFPTKEDMLAVLVEMLTEFQWKMMDHAADEGNSSLMAVCLEIPAMAAVCEENEIAKDFYLSAYTHAKTLDIIRKSDEARAKQVYSAYCQNWTDEQHAEAELLASGIEYATLMITENSLPLDTRVAGALNGILTIYNVPKEIREMKIRKVLDMDYRGLGRTILQDFMAFIEEVNENALEDMKRS